MQKNKLILGYILVILSAMIFGCMPLMTQFIYKEGVNSFGLVFWRNLLSLPMLAIAARVSGGSLKILPKSIPSIGWIAVFGCCLTPMLLYTAYTDIDTGVATVFHFVYPAIVMLLGLIFLKNKIKAGNLISLAVCIAGICVFYAPGAEIGALGSALALLSGVTYAIYIIGLAGFKYKEISGFVFHFYGTVCCTAVSFVICLCGGNLTLPSSVWGWILCALFGLIFNIGAVILFQRGTFIIGGERASILSTFEPITGVIIGMAFLGEPGSWRTAIGSALVLLASIMITIFDITAKKKDI